MSSKILDVTAVAEQSGVPLGKSKELSVVIDLMASGDAVGGPRPSLSVAFVLDASGSMNGQPITQVKDSVERLIDLLSESDAVGIVAFADNPVVVAEKAPLTSLHKQNLRRRLSALKAGGGTGMSRGLQSGAGLLGTRGENERQVVVLLTDGAPTDGSTKDSLGAIAQSFRPDVSTTTLGYGPCHQGDLLDTVARLGGGQYWYIPDPDEAQTEFARALGAQGDIVVDAVELLLQPGEGVEIIEVVGVAKTRFTSEGAIVGRPDLRAEQTHTTIVKLRIDARTEAQRLTPLKVEARFRKAGEKHQQRVGANVVVDVVHGEPSWNVEARKKVVLAWAEQQRSEARLHADQRRFDAASVLLKAVVAALEALPGYTKLDGSAVSEAVEQLIDEIQAYETKPSAEQYLEFRSTNLAVDLAQGARHQADVKMRSAQSQALMAGVAGNGVVVGDLVYVEKGGAAQRMPISGELTIGRVQGNDIVLAKGNISKRHTRFVVRDGKVIVVDLKATNGTFVNGKRVSSPVIVTADDKVYIGDFTFHFEPKVS